MNTIASDGGCETLPKNTKQLSTQKKVHKTPRQPNKLKTRTTTNKRTTNKNQRNNSTQKKGRSWKAGT